MHIVLEFYYKKNPKIDHGETLYEVFKVKKTEELYVIVSLVETRLSNMLVASKSLIAVHATSLASAVKE